MKSSKKTSGKSEQVTSQPLTLFPGDSHVNHSPAEESEKAYRITVTSGLRCLELSKNLNPSTLLAKTLLVSSRWTMAEYLETSWMIWKMKGITTKYLLFQLVPLEHNIGEIDSGFVPTPQATDWKDGKKTGHHNSELRHWLKIKYNALPSPTLYEKLMGYPIGWTDLKDSETQ